MTSEQCSSLRWRMHAEHSMGAAAETRRAGSFSASGRPRLNSEKPITQKPFITMHQTQEVSIGPSNGFVLLFVLNMQMRC